MTTHQRWHINNLVVFASYPSILLDFQMLLNLFHSPKLTCTNLEMCFRSSCWPYRYVSWKQSVVQQSGSASSLERVERDGDIPEISYL
jgi:hypothetical protein